jgi:polyisoprenoid-binding protein YceI
VKGTVNASGESKVEIEGTLTIHGASQPLTASAVVAASGDSHANEGAFRGALRFVGA